MFFAYFRFFQANSDLFQVSGLSIFRPNHETEKTLFVSTAIVSTIPPYVRIARADIILGCEYWPRSLPATTITEVCKTWTPLLRQFSAAFNACALIFSADVGWKKWFDFRDPGELKAYLGDELLPIYSNNNCAHYQFLVDFWPVSEWWEKEEMRERGNNDIMPFTAWTLQQQAIRSAHYVEFKLLDEFERNPSLPLDALIKWLASPLPQTHQFTSMKESTAERFLSIELPCAPIVLQNVNQLVDTLKHVC